MTTALTLGSCPWCPEGPREVVAAFEVPGEPVSKARHRRDPRDGHSYSPEKNAVAEAKVGWLFRHAAGAMRPSDTETFGVLAVFYTVTRHKRDVDNLLKIIFDALNGVCWKDDSQVSEAHSKIIKNQGPARSLITVYRTSG